MKCIKNEEGRITSIKSFYFVIWELKNYYLPVILLSNKYENKKNI